MGRDSGDLLQGTLGLLILKALTGEEQHGYGIVRSVLGQGLTLIVAGVICGAVAALWLGRFLAGLVFGVGTADPVTFGSVALLLATTALLASMIPALRAAHVDPASVLRSE